MKDNVGAAASDSVRDWKIRRGIFDMLRRAAADGRRKPLSMGEISDRLDSLYPGWQLGTFLRTLGVSQMENIVEAQLVAAFKSQADMLGGKDYRGVIGQAESLYRVQPRMKGITSKKLTLQQYSTPLTLAVRLGFFVRLGLCDSRVKLRGKSVPDWYCFEPTAGNGLLSAFIPPGNLVANELDPDRLRELRGILNEREYSLHHLYDSDRATFGGYHDSAALYCRDALGEDLYREVGGGRIRRLFRAMLINPPFDTLGAPSVFDGCRVTRAEHLITLKSLRLLHPRGRAALIIGGKARYDRYGILRTVTESPFIRYLYSHYVVRANVTFAGSTYAAQGANFPFRVILIDGVREAPDAGVLPLTRGEDPYFDHPATDFAELDRHIIPLISTQDTSSVANRQLLGARNNLQFIRASESAYKKIFSKHVETE